MLFGTKTRAIQDFLPRILSHIDGIDVDMAASYTMDAVIQFLRDTKLMTEVVCVPLEDCVNSYKLRTDNRIVEVLSVRFIVNNTQRPNHHFQYRVHGDVFYLDTIPTWAWQARVEVELAVAPLRDSDVVPDFIYEEWSDAITAMTLSKLYLLTDNEWYNPKAAGVQLSQYRQLARQARFSRMTKHKPLTMRLANKRRL